MLELSVVGLYGIMYNLKILIAANNMNIIKMAVLSLILALPLIGTAQAEDAPLKGIKLGFGFDQGFSVVGNAGNINAALGDKGVAIDYLFLRGDLKLDGTLKPDWFIGGGGFFEWDGDFGVRMPIGAELDFAKRFDAYAAFIPRLRFNNNDSNNSSDFGLDFAIGVRYQF